MNRVAIFLLLASTNTAAYAGDPAFYDNERLNRADVTGTVSVSAKAPKTTSIGDPAFYDNERINRPAPEDQAVRASILPVAIQLEPAADPAFYDNEPQRLKSGVR